MKTETTQEIIVHNTSAPLSKEDEQLEEELRQKRYAKYLLSKKNNVEEEKNGEHRGRHIDVYA